MWMSEEEWMSKAYSLCWAAIVLVAMVIMAGLYVRIVNTLWFKRDPDNQPTFQQRVRIKSHCLEISRITGQALTNENPDTFPEEHF